MKNNLLKAAIAFVSVMMCGLQHALAQDTSAEPVITFHTNRYQSMGSDNRVQISLMCMPGYSTTVKADFGTGSIRTYTVVSDNPYYGDDDELAGGTVVSGTVGESGEVRIWCDQPQLIDYLDAHGSELTDIEFSRLTNLAIVSLAHNAIHQLDLSAFTGLQYIEVNDNPFDRGLNVGSNHPQLYLLNINQLGDNALPTGTVDLKAFPSLRQFTAWDTKCLRSLDVTHNTMLNRISIDNSGVRSLDVSQNSNLLILNVSDCGFSSLDVSHNPYLVELYVANQGQNDEEGRVINELDITNNPHLQRLFVSGNNLTHLDVSNARNMVSLIASHNHLSSFDVSMIDSLAELDISVNDFDFATLPDVDPKTYFYYDFQRDLKVDYEYGVGHKLDLSHRVLRKDTYTQCGVYTVSREVIDDPVPLEPGYDYVYEDGVITFLRPQTDSVFALFANSLYTGVTLSTTRFLVRSAEDFGKPVELFSFLPDAEAGAQFTFKMSQREDMPLYVNAGDGQLTPIEISAEGTVSFTYAGGRVSLMGPVGTDIRTLSLDGIRLHSIGLDLLVNLETLSLSGCALPEIDLSWNHCLKSLCLDENNLSVLILDGENDAFHKNVLNTVSARHNQLTEFRDIINQTLVNVDLSYNCLADIDLSGMNVLRNLDLSHNQLLEVNLNQCPVLESLCLTDNLLTGICLDSCQVLSSLDIRNNKMRLSALPQVTLPFYAYAPQLPIRIATTGPMSDLSTEAVIGGQPTTYTWRNTETSAVLAEGTDYTLDNGITRFLAPAVGQTVICQLANAVFPDAEGDNACLTTPILVSSGPQHKVASFVTTRSGQTAQLSLAAVEPDTYIYIDWGDGMLQEFALQTTYRLFASTTIANAEVSVWSSNEEDGGISVFSISAVSMSSADVSKLSRATCITLADAGLTSIDLSHNTLLRELALGGNNMRTIDLSHNTQLSMVYLNDNRFTSLDLSSAPSLSWVQAGHNRLESVNLSGLTHLGVLDLTGNKLETIDLSTNTALTQLSLPENKFRDIDLSHNTHLNVVDLNNNYFDLTTLPLPGQYNIYNYANQAPLQISSNGNMVDISSHAVIADSASTFYWFTGTQLNYGYDAVGNMVLNNDELIEGQDFTVEGGVSTFVSDWESLFCYIYNPLFPNIIYLTTPVSISGTGISQLDATASKPNAEYYSLDGRRLDAIPSTGLFIHSGKVINVR
ncbi:MAG: hypothetical protein KBT20_11220 [Bacteroidales bacterium]|nr:hypothetical protein [Candidatus Liminaster caballi]